MQALRFQVGLAWAARVPTEFRLLNGLAEALDRDLLYITTLSYMYIIYTSRLQNSFSNCDRKSNGKKVKKSNDFSNMYF